MLKFRAHLLCPFGCGWWWRIYPCSSRNPLVEELEVAKKRRLEHLALAIAAIVYSDDSDRGGAMAKIRSPEKVLPTAVATPVARQILKAWRHGSMATPVA